MTVASDVQDVTYNADGSTVAFPLPFYFLRDADVRADRIDATGASVGLVLGTDFSLSGAGDPAGGELVTFATIATGNTLHIYRDVPATQETQYQQNDPFPAKTTEKALDKLTMLIQRNGALVGTGIRYPFGERQLNAVLPPAPSRENRALGFDNKGEPFMIDLTIGSVAAPVVSSVANLRLVSRDTATTAFVTSYYGDGKSGGGQYFQRHYTAPAGWENGGTQITGADGGGWELVLSGPPSIEHFGCVGDDMHDDTLALRAAIAACYQLEVPQPAVAYRLTDTITIHKPTRFLGYGVSLYTIPVSSGSSPRGPGSWFHLAHSGIGFRIEPGTTSLPWVLGVCFDLIGTYRDHPEPNGAAAWAPTVSDFDFFFDNAADCEITNSVLWNPYRGIGVTGSAGGRHYFRNIRGQPFYQGIVFDCSEDIDYVENIHFWPFWSLAPGVIAYTLANLNALTTARADGIRVTNFFSIAHAIGWFFTQNATYGNTYKAKGINLDFDNGACGILMDPACGTNGFPGVTAQLTNVTMQGGYNYPTPGGPASSGIDLRGRGYQIHIDQVDVQGFGGAALTMSGPNGILSVRDLRSSFYNQNNLGNAGVFVGSGNELSIDGRWELSDQYGAAQFTVVPGGHMRLPQYSFQLYATTDSTGHVTAQLRAKGVLPTSYKAVTIGGTTTICNSVSSQLSGVNASVTFQVMDPKTESPVANTNVGLMVDVTYEI